MLKLNSIYKNKSLKIIIGSAAHKMGLFIDERDLITEIKIEN